MAITEESRHRMTSASKRYKLEAAFHRELRAQTYRMLGFFTAVMAVVVAAVKI